MLPNNYLFKFVIILFQIHGFLSNKILIWERWNNRKLICMETRFEYNFRFTQEDVLRFAEATGDKNPIHLDEEYASKNIFGKRIMHGFLGGSVFSRIFGTMFPGEGTIYLKQDMKFIAPMFVDTSYKAIIEIKEVIPEKSRAIAETSIANDKGEIAIKGEALIQHSCFGQ